MVEPRVMQVLVALIRAGGQIVSRDDLMMSCWHGVVVGEDAINRVMGRVRRLADGIGGGEIKLETVTKVGYRLVATSHAIETRSPAPAQPTENRVSICVLPFANMSDDPQQAYFSDGICEDIITDLAKVSALSVVARSTAFTFKGKAIDVPEVARQLKVSHVLEGQRSQSRRPGSHHRPADRRRRGRSRLERTLGPRPHRHLRPAGRDFRGDRRRAQAQAAAGGEAVDRAARHRQCRGLQSLSDGAPVLRQRQSRRSAGG
ncbi:MAG: winged helix-turn-helix domain-containing protein [Caulobacteraceae bacterium]